MTVETATYISDLNATYPASGDPKAEGDDHLRLVKIVTKNTWPNVSGAVTPTHTELNYVDGVTSGIQSQLDTLTGTFASYAPLASPALTGTPTAPTASAGSATTQLANTAFVSATAFSAVLPGQSGNAGKIIRTDGTAASWQLDGGPINVISTNTAAALYGTYVFTASLTLTLPAAPDSGDWVIVSDRSGLTTCVIGRNGLNIMGLAQDMTLDVANSAFRLRYIDSTRGWVFA